MSWGGKRAGAGRRVGSGNRAKVVAVDIAREALASIDQIGEWQKLMHSKDEKIRLQALSYLTDRAYGKAQTSVNLQGDALKLLVEYV
jgi:hypothetical protein